MPFCFPSSPRLPGTCHVPTGLSTPASRRNLNRPYATRPLPGPLVVSPPVEVGTSTDLGSFLLFSLQSRLSASVRPGTVLLSRRSSALFRGLESRGRLSFLCTLLSAPDSDPEPSKTTLCLGAEIEAFLLQCNEGGSAGSEFSGRPGLGGSDADFEAATKARLVRGGLSSGSGGRPEVRRGF